MLTDSTSKTNLPMLRKPFSGVLPPHVPIVASDNLGGVKTVGGVTSVRMIFVNGRVIEAIPDTNLGGYSAKNEFKGLYLKDGELVASENLEHVEISPVGGFTVPVAKVKLSGGEEFTINVPAQKKDTNSIKTTPGSGRMPLMTPVWLDYIADQDSGCIPVLDAGGNHIAYPGRYTFGSSPYATGGNIIDRDFFGSTNTYDSTMFDRSISGNTVTYTAKKAFKCLLQTTSGRNFGKSIEMSVRVNVTGEQIVHRCPVNQTYAFSNTQVYNLDEGSSIVITVSGSSNDGWASVLARPMPPTSELLFKSVSGSWVESTDDDIASDGTLKDGIAVYVPTGTTVSGKSVAFKEVFDHILQDYNSGSNASDTYTLSDGTTVEINYKLAADKHKICDTTQIGYLNQIYNDSSVGEAFYYVIDGTAGTIRFPRTRHGFHGDRGYGKVGAGHACMYLHFIAG